MPAGCPRWALALPIGLHLVGRSFNEGAVLRAAHAYRQAMDWHQRAPPV